MTLLFDPEKVHPTTVQTLSMRAEFRRTFNQYMHLPCRAHHAREGQPCWTIARDGNRNPSRAVCGARIDATRRKKRRAARSERVAPLVQPARALPRAATPSTPRSTP